ncbi:hypothetical protein [Polaribacter sp.]|uniref:hypothetical protein n=1 Tax=Polaribacter sp. TaxID=1920175 RepID=UPI003F6CA009
MKTKIAFFFSIIFISLLITPTIISLVDNSQNIAYFIDINEEEEENNGKEESKVNTEIKIETTSYCKSFVINNIQKSKKIRFLSKKYTCKYSKIATPPPRIIA